MDIENMGCYCLVIFDLSELVSKSSSIRSLLNLYLKDSQEIESLVNLIPENLITEYHLRDVFNEEGKI